MSVSLFVLLPVYRFKTFPCAAVEVKNEPILGFQEGSQERAELQKVNAHLFSDRLTNTLPYFHEYSLIHLHTFTSTLSHTSILLCPLMRKQFFL